MFHVKDDFTEGGPIAQVPASWFNSVAKFLNNLISGRGIRMQKEGDGAVNSIELDAEFPSGQTEDTVLVADATTGTLRFKSAAGTETSPSATSGISITPDYYDSTSSQATRQAYLNMTAWKPPVKLVGDDSNHTPVGWERGKTAWKNGHDVDENHPAVGCSVKVVSHYILRTVSGTQKMELFFTRLDFDEKGILVRAVPCTDWFTIP